MDSTATIIPRPALRAWSSWAGRLLLSLVLLWFALRQVPLASLKAALGHADPFWSTLSVLVYLAGLIVFESLRLAASARMLAENQPRAVRWLALFVESRAFLYLLPSGMGQEGYLWLKLRKDGWDHSSCGFVVLTVRVTGLACWGLSMAWALGSPSFQGACRSLLYGPMAAPTAWVLLSAALLALSLVLPEVFRRMGRLPKHKLAPGPWAGLLAATAGAMICVALPFQMAARAFGLPFSLDQAAGCLTLLFIGLALPVSLAGIGLQEGVLLLLGRGLGLASGPILGLSCLLHLQRLIPSLLGMAMLFFRKKN